MEIDLSYIVIEMMIGVGGIPIVVGHQTFVHEDDAITNAVRRATANSSVLECEIREEIEAEWLYGENNWSVCVRKLLTF